MEQEKKLFTLKSARVTVDLKQDEVVEILKDRFDYFITRQKLAEYERDSTKIPMILAEHLAEIYFLNRNDIFFGDKSVLSYTYRISEKQEA